MKKDPVLRILLIEDNAGDAELILEMGASFHACTLQTTDRLSSALTLLEKEPFDAVLLDLELPDSSGIDTIRRFQEKASKFPVIVLTGLADYNLATEAISLGAQDYLVKGQFDGEVLVRAVRYARERKRAEEELRTSRDLSDALNSLNEVIHSSLDLDTIIQRVVVEAARVVQVDASSIGMFHGEAFVMRYMHNMPQDLIGQSIPSEKIRGVHFAKAAKDVVAFNDVVHDDRVSGWFWSRFGIRSLMVAPLIIREEVLGALSFYCMSRPLIFTGEYIDFARKLAVSLSLALENSRLFSALLENEERFRTLADNIAQFAWMADETGCIFWYNKRWYEYTGTTFNEMECGGWMEVLHPDHIDRVLNKIDECFKTGQFWEDTFPLLGKDGHFRWFLSRAIPIKDEKGKVIRWFGTSTDITEQKRLEEEIRHMAHHDTLTGLPNRRLFHEFMGIETAQARRHETKLAILFLDLDRFKEINDTLGHNAGDELLMEVATRLRAGIRKSDTVARIGGDEFNIILSDIIHAEDSADIARKIMKIFYEPFPIAGHELHVTTSIGISVYPDDSTEVDTLLRYADIAMYHAKELGKNNFQFYNADINVRSIERISTENWLRQSVDRRELTMHYQPQVDISTRRIICAEALVRWRHPERGLLEPVHFIPLAEETGFITVIDDWVLREVCTQGRAWIDAGMPSFCVTVNLSARQFQRPELVTLVAKVLEETGMPPDCLEIEITESMAMSNVERTADRFKELVKMGIHISIDDFGTGYSSLNYLKRLPIDRLKIDKSFIQDIATDADDRAIINAVTAMAHNMKMKVIAEGVETEDQLSFLHASECDEAQGYFFSRPLPAEEFRELIRSER